jgi:hypothetical protein
VAVAVFGHVAASIGPEVALRPAVAQRIVEMLIGRLITDEQFRATFLGDPETTLLELCARGFELTQTEIAALANTDPVMWAQAAAVLDARLQKASLEREPHSLKERSDV